MKTRSNSFRLALRVLTVILAGLLTSQFLSAQGWYNNNWSFRRAVTIPNPGTTELTEFQVKITLNNTFDFSKTLAGGSDIRVAASDGTTLIPFWIEEWNPAGTTASIWVKVPTIPTDGTTVYVYYGGSSSPSAPTSELVETPPVGPYIKYTGNPISSIPGANINIPDLCTNSILPENLIFDGAKYWVLVSNRCVSPTSLSLVSSTDLVSWVHEGIILSAAIIGAPGRDFDSPCLVKANDTWYIFYSNYYGGWSEGSNSAPIGIARSTTGNIMGPYVELNRAILPCSSTFGAWDDARVSEPYVIQRENGDWVMVYMGDADPAGGFTEQVGIAISTTGIEGPYIKSTGNPVIAFGPAGSIDAGTIADPWVVRFGTTYYIGYTASPTKSGWNTTYATTADWNTFVKSNTIILNQGPGTYDLNSAFRGAVTRVGDTYLFPYTAYGSGGFQFALATQPVYAGSTNPADITSNAEAVFEFYDGFDGTVLDAAKWSIRREGAGVGTTSVSGGILTVQAPIPPSGHDGITLTGNRPFGPGMLLESSARHPDADGSGGSAAEMGFGNPLRSLVFRIMDYNRPNFIKNVGGEVYVDMATGLNNTNYLLHSIFWKSSTEVDFALINNIFESLAISPTTNIPPWLFCVSIGRQATLMIDWIRVRKFTGTDPVASVGPEQFDGTQWEGDISIDWNDPENWTAGVPAAGTNVLIATGGTYMPQIGAVLAYCRNITINSGMTLELAGAHNLTVSGNWTNNGYFSPNGTGSVIFNGSNQTIGGSSTYHLFNNLVISVTGSVTLNANADLNGNLSMTSGIFDLGNYTINNVVAGVGSLDLSGGATMRIGGERTLPAGYETHSIGATTTVEYYGSNQAIGALNSAQSYGNLKLSGSGTKTFPDVILAVTSNLSISEAAIASLSDGRTYSVGYLTLGGVGRAIGTWGSESSPATNKTNTYFLSTNTGVVNVLATFPSGTWVGEIDADWNTPSNWFGGSVPGSGTDVIIPATAANNPVITKLPVAVCRDLTVNAGASLTIKAGQALTVSGALSNSGTLTIESSSVLANGSLIVTGASTGNVTYNRIVNTSNNLYHFFSSPVGTTTFPTAGTVWGYNEPTGAWVETTVNVPGRGYTLAKGITSLSFNGAVVTTDVPIEASSPYVGTIAGGVPGEYDARSFADGRNSTTNWGGGGWNLLGNPYTSALNVGGFISGNSGQFDPNYLALYLYNGSSYRYVSNPVGPWLNGTAMNENYIQAGQGFFVLAMNDASTFTFRRSMQGHDTDVLLLKSAKTDDNWPGLQLNARFGEKESSTLVVYNDNMSAGLDPGYDIGLMSSGPDVDLYTALALKDNGVNFTRQVLPISEADKLKVSVGIDSEKGGEVTFSAITVPLGTYKFWLEDRFTGIFTDLGRSTYTVTIPAQTYGTGRFFIVASTNTPTGIIKPQSDDTGVRIWTSDGKLIIKGEVSDKAICEIYDLQGRIVISRKLADGELNTVDIPSGLNGAFLVRVIDGLKITTRKIAIL